MHIGDVVTLRFPSLRHLLATAGVLGVMVLATSALAPGNASAANGVLSDHEQPGAHQAAPAPDSEEEAAPAPAARAILLRLAAMGLLPEQAVQMLDRGVIEHSEAQAPGRVCRRIAQADQAPSEMVERCRTWFENQRPAPVGHTAAELCRRIAGADDPDATLIERCRAWIAAQEAPDRPTVRELCARVLAADSAPEELVERCEALASTRPEVERPARPEVERPVRPERADRPALPQPPIRR